MNPFFDEAGATLVEEAHARGLSIDTPKLPDDVAQELLELARVVAHTRERRFAPLSTFLAGIAVAQMRAKRADIDVAGYIKAVRAALETPSP